MADTPQETPVPEEPSQVLTRLERLLAAPPAGSAPAPMSLTYYLRCARSAEERAAAYERQQAQCREHADRARTRGDLRIMQAGRQIADARKERDRWLGLAGAVAANWEESFPAPQEKPHAVRNPPAPRPAPAGRSRRR